MRPRHVASVYMVNDVINVALHHLALLRVRHAAIIANSRRQIGDELIVRVEIVSRGKLLKLIAQTLIVIEQNFRCCFWTRTGPAHRGFRKLPLAFLLNALRTAARPDRIAQGAFGIA